MMEPTNLANWQDTVQYYDHKVSNYVVRLRTLILGHFQRGNMENSPLSHQEVLFLVHLGFC